MDSTKNQHRETVIHCFIPKGFMIVQSDRTILLEVDNPHFIEARNALARFAELEKSPDFKW